jgi:hypothetical protein
MATLILTAVGTAVGGPIGGALGAILGNGFDRAVLFKGKGREGPRLTELAVQTSSYGTPIARLYGTMRVAGTVIWSTDLIEQSQSEGGGKRGPSTTNYSYSASFAVLLSARPIREVRRIWADGKLLRGAGGDWKTPTTFRLHLGGEDQQADPLIASAEGVGMAPAHRGSAYAVFEHLQLADFGNRIPSLTFEVVADEGAVSSAYVARELSGGLVGGSDAGLMLGGYAAYGATLRGVIEGLAEASGAWFGEDGERLELRCGAGSATTIDDEGAGAGGKRGSRRVRTLAAADVAPKRVAVSHYDAARDYQTGLQQAVRPGAGMRTTRIELPAVIDAGAAKALATATLARLDVARERRRVALDWRRIAVAPGDRVRIAGEPGLWRVTGWTLEAMVLTLELARIARATVAAGATPGRVTAASDIAHGPTIVFAFETPAIDDGLRSAPRLTIVAAGTSPGWRRAALTLSSDGGARWTPAGTTRAPGVLGWVAVAPGAAPSTLVDRRHAIEVTLAHSAMVLNDADAAALDGGANLAIVGDELVQFGRATRIGDTRWRLSELWRGRRGTEHAAGAQAVGDRFALLDPATLAHVDLPLGTLGTTVSVMASGIGDDADPPVAVAAVTGASILPPAPAHLRARMTNDGLALDWVRRSRAGWRWLDGVDAPLAEESERYRVAFETTPMSLGAIEAIEPRLALSQDRVAPGAIAALVRQIGAYGASGAARVTLDS